MPKLCIKCNEKPIAIKKSQLCNSCYQKERQEKHKEYQEGIKEHYRITRRMHFSEMDFIKNFFTHNNWIYEPVRFRLNDTSYTPDFYDAERNIFIEVVGTRQAYHQNKEKYQLLKKLYPRINFEIRGSNGKILDKSENSA